MVNPTLNTVPGADMSLEDIENAIAALEAETAGAESDTVLEALEGEVIAADAIVEGEPTIGADAFVAENPEPVVEADAVDDAAIEAIVGEIAHEAAKAELYAEQEPGADATLEAKGEPTPTKPAADGTTPAKPAKSGTPRTRGSIRDLEPANFVLDANDAESDPAALKDALLAAMPKAKKCGEKVENLLLAVSAGKLPSVYTMVAVNLLIAKGEFTSAELVAAMQATKYSIGTSRSQSQQMMTILPIVKIAKKDGAKLVRNPDSVLIAAIEAIRAGAALPAAPASEPAPSEAPAEEETPVVAEPTAEETPALAA